MYIDSGAVALTDVNTWKLVASISLKGDKSGAKDGDLIGGLLALATGAAALSDLKITRAPGRGSDHVDWYSGIDFSVPTQDMPTIVPSGLNTLAANSKGFVRLAGLLGTCELGIWAKGTGTSLRVFGTIL